MKKFKLKIPSVEIKDLTIIYKEGEDKLHEIKTSKKEVLANLHFFESRSNEINLTNMIYIEENVPFSLFSDFISSIHTKEIEIDENNYESYLYLSNKYQFYELQEEIKQFSESRPDIKSIIEDLKKSVKLMNQDNCIQPQIQYNDDQTENHQINSMREEMIAKNLDICIQNCFLDQIPIQILVRILNSPKRVIKDHHLLFSFVIDLIEKSKKVTLTDTDRENILILPSCLDYCQMDDEEVKKLLEVEKSSDFFAARNADKRIRQFFENEAETNRKLLHLQSQIDEMKKREEEYIKRIDFLEKGQAEMREKNDQRIGNEKAKEEENKKRIVSLEQRIGNVEKEIGDEKEKEEENKKRIISLEQRINAVENQSKDLKKVQIEKQSIQCQYSNDPLSGIIKYLEGTSKDEQKYEDIIKISAGGSIGQSAPVINLIKYDSNSINNIFYNYYNNGKPSSSEGWIEFDFINHKVNLTSYVLRNGISGSSCPKSWQIVGSDDGRDWDTLSHQVGTNVFKGKNRISEIFECTPNSKYYRFIRYIQEDSWSSGYEYSICLSCVEFFGSII